MELILHREQVAQRKLIWVGPLTLVSTLIVNLILRAIAVSIFGVPETFQYVQAPYVIGSTIIFFVLLALLVFVLVNRFAQHPIRLIVYWRSLPCASRFSVPLWLWSACTLLLA